MSSAGVDIGVKAWAPAVSCRIPDNIVSSDYTAARKFVASYERDRRPCMERLLTNEYQRIWWKEKALWDKLSMKTSAKRRLLLRGLVKKRPPALTVSCATAEPSTSATDPKAREPKNVRAKERKAQEARKTTKLRSQECAEGKPKEENAANGKRPGIVKCR